MQSKPFKMTLAGLFAYHIHYNFKKTITFRLFLVICLCAALGYGTHLYFDKGGGSALSFVIALLVPSMFLATAFVLIFYLIPAASFWAAKLQGSYASDNIVSISESHLRLACKGTEMTTPWHDMDSISVTAHHFLFYFSRCGAFVIPKDAFETPASAEAFVTAAKSHLQMARERGGK